MVTKFPKCFLSYRAIIVIATVALYFHTLSFGITKSDDDVLILNNLPFLKHLPNLLTVFTSDAFYQHRSIDLYRPLQSATFILDAQWGLNPIAVAHLTNLIIHVITCCTVFELLKLLEFREKIALLGALVYVCHYLLMTAVAWLPARGDLLLALFSFLTLATFIKAITTGGLHNYLLHGICFSAAIFSKESAIVLPIVLGLYVWTYGKMTLLKRRDLLLPLFYLAVQLFYFTLKSRSVIVFAGDMGVVPFLKNIRTLPETVAKFYLPLNMSTLPAYTAEATAVGVLILAAFVFLHLCRRFGGGRRELFFACWTLVFMVPGMAYYPSFYSFAYEHLDHRAYITCFGLLLINLNVLQKFGLDNHKHFLSVSLLLLVYLATCNLFFSESYRNPTQFALRAIKTNPKSAHAYAILGTELYLEGRDDEALDSLNKSLQLFDRFSQALHTRALVYRKRGMDKEALADLDTLLKHNPESGDDDYVLRAQIRLDQGNYAGAIGDFQAAARLNPGNAEAQKALKELQRTVRNNRLLPQASLAQQYNRQGIEAGKRGDFKAAEALFRKAIGCDPGFAGANVNRGNALYELGRVDEACVVWSIAADQGSATAADFFHGYCGR